MDFRSDQDRPDWIVDHVVTVQCRGGGENTELRLGKDYVVARCSYTVDDVKTWQVRIARYLDPEPEVFVWDYSTP